MSIFSRRKPEPERVEVLVAARDEVRISAPQPSGMKGDWLYPQNELVPISTIPYEVIDEMAHRIADHVMMHFEDGKEYAKLRRLEHEVRVYMSAYTSGQPALTIGIEKALRDLDGTPDDV